MCNFVSISTAIKMKFWNSYIVFTYTFLFQISSSGAGSITTCLVAEAVSLLRSLCWEPP